MSKSVKGLNVVIGAETKGLQAALRDVNKASRDIAKELRQVENLLKFNPHDTEALAQKQKLLGDQVATTAEKLKTLKAAQESVNKQFAEGDISAEQHRAFQRELVKTESQLKNYEEQLKAATRAAEPFNARMQELSSRLKGVGESITSLGTDLSKKLTVPLAGIGVIATKVGKEFEASMSKVQAYSGATAEDMADLEKAARDAGAATSKSATDAADALGYMSLAGWSTKQSVEGLMPVLRLAEAGNIDLARASSLVTDSMSALGLTTAELGSFLDTIAQTARNSNTNIDQMAEAYIRVGGTLRGLNVPLNESSVAMGLLANAGIKGSEAGTSLNAVLLNLTAPAGRAKQALEDLGYSAFDSQGDFKGLEQVLFDLRDMTSTMSDEQRNLVLSMIGGKEHVRSLNALLNGLGDGYDDLKVAVDGANGALNDMAETMLDNTQGSLVELGSALEELALKIYDIMQPTIRSVIESIKGLVQWLDGLSPSVQRTAVVIGAALAALGPALVIIGKLATGVAGLTAAFGSLAGFIGSSLGGPITLAIAAVAGLGVAIMATKKDMTKMYDAAIDVAIASNKQANELQSLVDEYKELEGKPDKSEAEHRRLEEVMQAIIRIQPNIARGYRDIGEAIKSNIDTLETYIETMRAQGKTAVMQAQIEFEIRRPDLESELERLEIKAIELETEVKPLQQDAFGVAAMVSEYKLLLAELEFAMEEGMIDRAGELEAQLKGIVHSVMPELDTGRDEFGRWLSGLEQHLKKLEKTSGGTAEELKAVNDRITTIKQELERGYSLENALNGMDGVGEVAEKEAVKVVEAAQEVTEVIVEESDKQKEEREKFEAQWNAKLFELTAERLEKLEAEYNEAIALAEKHGADKTAIEEYYSIMRARIAQDEQDAINEELRRSNEARDRIADDYNKKLFEQTADRIDILQREKQEQIKIATKAGADWLLVDTYYNNLIAEERKRLADEQVATEADKLRRMQEVQRAFDDEWNRRLFEQSADRIDILQREKQEQIKIALETGQDWLKIDTYYNNLIAEERRRIAEQIAKDAEEDAKADADRMAQRQATRDRIEADWHKRLFELSADRIDILQREKQEQIKIAMEAGADWLVVDEYYNRLIKDERERRADEIIKIAENEAKREAEIQALKQREIDSYEADWNKRAFDSSANRIDILQREYQEELKIAAEKKADTAAIISYYENEITKERQRQADERARIAEREAEEESRTREERLAFEKQWTDKLFELTATPEMRLDRLEQEAREMEELAIKMEASAESIQAIQEYYARRRAQVEEEIAEQSKSIWQKMAEMTDPIEQLKDKFVSAGQNLAGFVEDIRAGDWKSAFTQILLESESFAEALEVVSKVLEPVIRLLDAILLPVIRFVAESLRNVANFFIDAINGVIKILNKIPFVNIDLVKRIEFDEDDEDEKDKDKDKDKGKGRSGSQISEITGPTRDLFVDLLTPLSHLGQVVAPIQDIRQILYDRLPNFNQGYALAGAGNVNVTIQNFSVTAPTTGSADVSEVSARELERLLAESLASKQRGRGGR